MARPLERTYDPKNPYVVERVDHEDGSITYEVFDTRPDTYRIVCVVAESYNDDTEDGSPDRGQSMKDANMIAAALNMVYGTREFKSATLRTIPKQE